MRQAAGEAARLPGNTDGSCNLHNMKRIFDLSEVACSPPMDGGVAPGGSPSRMACPAEEGGEGALAAAEKAPALLWGSPVTMHEYHKMNEQRTSHFNDV